MHPMLNIAIRCTRKASNFIAKYYKFFDVLRINKKNQNNFITNIKCEAEQLIIEGIHKSYPKHTVISEINGTLIGKDYNIEWIINSIDGSINFMKNFPHFSISIAVRINNLTEISVVYNPMNNELFTATRGQGTQLNGYRLRNNNSHNLDELILATRFPFKQKQHANNYFNLLKKLFAQCADFRFTGSSSLDLAYVAANRVDGYFALDVKPWSFVSGELLVREAGGLVTDFTGNCDYPVSGSDIIAGNPKILKYILAIICKI